MAETLVVVFKGYWLIGLGFGAWFALKGAARLDPAAAHGTWGFRLLVVPGAAMLWPVLAVWLAGSRGRPPEERNAHRVRARAGATR